VPILRPNWATGVPPNFSRPWPSGAADTPLFAFCLKFCSEDDVKCTEWAKLGGGGMGIVWWCKSCTNTRYKWDFRVCVTDVENKWATFNWF
jgi:hypothetical protein